MTPFCLRHITSFLNELELTPQPVDLALSRYFRKHKSLGAHDRRTMGDSIFGMVRWKGLIEWLYPSSPTEKRVEAFLNLDWEKIKTRSDIPHSIRLGITPYLYEKLFEQFGEEKTVDLCQILNGPAPVTIRVNLLKTNRDALFESWKDRFSIAKCEKSSTAIHFGKREPLFSLPEFKEGLFEMQDLGSQLIADLVDAKPGDLVLDYCSGSGGKTLALAPRMQGKGQIYLHDIREHVLAEAKKRLKRAGIQNAQCLLPSHPQIKKLINHCGWVLIDVPCSGSGTLRRNPDQKWKIDRNLVDRLVELQRDIAKKAVRFVKPGGHLIYATCSLLREENESQVEWILKELNLKLVHHISFLPEAKGSDGFFGAVFKKN